MKRLALILMVSTLLLVGGPAFAELCTIDAVPAATLLLPYFEVDTAPNGVNTIFSINNASAAPALAHVTLWTDWSWPSIDFDIFLTGYDIQVVNLNNLFTSGAVTSENDPGEPITDHEATDGAADEYSPHGANPEWDGSFADCSDFLPFNTNPLFAGLLFDRLEQAHSGQPVDFIGGFCTGADYGDGVYRGYITVDNAVRCSTEFANDPGYFGGADPVASNENQLWGEYFIVDPANDFMQGEPLVHIEAGPATPPFVGGDNGYTFYSRFTFGAGNTDQREPLGTQWAARYFNNPLFTGGTSFLVWRDSTSADLDPTVAPWQCGAPGSAAAGPSWHPLNEIAVYAFDERENAEELCFTGEGGRVSPPIPGTDPACFPLETQLISSTNLAFTGIGPSFDSGWMYLDLNVGTDSPVFDYDPVFAEGAQSYVSVHHSANGRYSVGLQAIELTSACDDTPLSIEDICDPQFPGGPAIPCTPGG